MDMQTNHSRPGLLIISHDVVGSRMAGPGIRYWEMARALADTARVTLLAPGPIDLVDPVLTLASYEWGRPTSLAPFLATSDLVLANGFVLQAHPELAGALPLIVDLYDPVPLENLELFRQAPLADRRARQEADVRNLVAQVAAGDFFLCATERQRDLYLGVLLALDRVTPAAVDHDKQLRELIDVVPFGLPVEAPPAERRLRDALGIAAGDPLVIWSGGLWDWLDPLALVEAWPRVTVRHSNARLVFLAGPHPGGAHPMRTPAATRARADELGLSGRQIFFYEAWLPYAERAAFLNDADIAVSLHHDHLETAFAAVRSRFLDYLWIGLPAVVSSGDAAAQLVATHGLGRVVAPGDVAGIAAALSELIADAEMRRTCAARARALAQRYRWDLVVEPLRRFCRRLPGTHSGEAPVDEAASTEEGQPQPDAPPRLQFAAMPEYRTDTTERDRRARERDAARNNALADLHRTYQVHEQPLPDGGALDRWRQPLIERAVRPFVAPLIEQQNAHNAAVLRALDQIANNSDQRRSEMYDSFDDLQQLYQSIKTHVETQIAAMNAASHARIDHLHLELWQHIEARVRYLEQLIGQNQSAISRLRERSADLDDNDTLLAERILALLQDRPAPEDGS